jgi:hypothetical protein
MVLSFIQRQQQKQKELQLQENVLQQKQEEPIIFRERLETLKSQLPSILNDFKKYYVFFNKNPEYPEYRQMFQNIKGNLTKINNDLFVLSNDIQINTQEINKKLLKLNTLIYEEKKQTRELKVKLNIVENTNNASTELINDYNEMYNTDYLHNWGLFLSIIIAGITIKKVFT